MKNVTNTTKKPMFSWLLGGNPKAIENQESEGQEELVNSSQLPIDMNPGDAKEQYEKMGIKVIGKSEGDNIFYDVVMPSGWRKESTDHSMWNKLIDDKGRVRAMFFYKAAFYDRSSHINFGTRYQISTEHFQEEKSTKHDWDHARIYQVVDTATKDVLFSGEKHFFGKQDECLEKARTWLSENFPDWRDINAYW